MRAVNFGALACELPKECPLPLNVECPPSVKPPLVRADNLGALARELPKECPLPPLACPPLWKLLPTREPLPPWELPPWELPPLCEPPRF